MFSDAALTWGNSPGARSRSQLQGSQVVGVGAAEQFGNAEVEHTAQDGQVVHGDPAPAGLHPRYRVVGPPEPIGEILLAPPQTRPLSTDIGRKNVAQR